MTEVYIKAQCNDYEGQGEYWVKIDGTDKTMLINQNAIINRKFIDDTNPTFYKYLTSRRNELLLKLKSSSDENERFLLKIRINELNQVFDAIPKKEDDMDLNELIDSIHD